MKQLLSYIFLLFIMSLNMFAFHDKNHIKITNQAVDNSDHIDLFFEDMKIGSDVILIDANSSSLIEQGSVEEDGWKNWPIIAFNPTAKPYEDIRRTVNHFYDPVHNMALDDPCISPPSIILPTPYPAPLWALDGSPYLENHYSLEEGKEYLYKGLTANTEYFRKRYLEKFFLSMGHFVHMIQDMAVPAHVRNDDHGLNILKPFTSETDRYEVYCAEHFDTIDYNQNYVYRFSTFLYYWTTFTDMGLADFTNMNFVSQDTNLYHSYYECRSESGNVFELPEKNGLYHVEEWHNEEFVHIWYAVNTVEDLYTGDTYYNNHLSAFSYWDFFTESIGYYTYSLNNKCFADYAEILIPRATGYSTGLLDHFFEPRIEAGMAYDQQIEAWTIYVLNTSDLDYGEGHIQAFWFEHREATGWPWPSEETHWLDQYGHSIQLNGNTQFYINGLSSGQAVDIFNTDLDLPDNYAYPTIDILVLFNGIIDGENNRTVAKVINLDLTYVDIHFDKILFEDFAYTHDEVPNYSGYCKCKPNTWGGCSNVWYFMGDWRVSARSGYKQSIYASIPPSSRQHVQKISIDPLLYNNSRYELFVNGISMGQEWNKSNYPNMVPETLMIRLNYNIWSSSTGHPFLKINGYQKIHIPNIQVDHHWGLYDKITGIHGGAEDCPFYILGPPHVSADYNVIGWGLVNSNGQTAEGNTASIVESIEFGDPGITCRGGIDCDYMEGMASSAYGAMVAWYNNYTAQFSNLRPIGEMKKEYTDEEKAYAEMCGRYLPDYTFPIRSPGQ